MGVGRGRAAGGAQDRESAEPALHAAALAQLAELRLAQGRLEEASRLLVGYADHPAAILAIAALHLVRGDHAVASSLIRRRLGDVDPRTLTGARLVELLGEAEIARGDRESAAERGRDLVDLGTGVGSELIVARGEFLLGRASGDAEDAITHLGRALSTFREHSIPLGAGRARLQLARVLVAAEREAAIVEARGALELFEALGAARDADEAAGFLREHRVKAARTGPRGFGILTRRELDVLALLGEGLLNPDIAERLFISRKTVEHHVASVLATLQLGGRGEATAYAIRALDTQRGSAPRWATSPMQAPVASASLPSQTRRKDATMNEPGSQPLGEHTVVIGASIAGLLVARALSERYGRVTIVERDTLPAIGEGRKAVPQGRHAHALLASGQRAIETLLPGITAELVDAGARSRASMKEIRMVVAGHRITQDAVGPTACSPAGR